MAQKKEITEVDISSLLNNINDLVTAFNQSPEPSVPEEDSAAADAPATDPSTTSFDTAQLEEIKLGKEQFLDTEIYARNTYNWMQMREIRKGLLTKVDVSLYKNPLFTAPQMKEIRLGLADRLDVSSYAKLILSATDMQKERVRLFSKAYQENPKRFGRTVEIREKQITLRVSEDYLKVFIKLSKNSYVGLGMESLLELLSDYDLDHNLIKSSLKKILSEKPCDKEICIAGGRPATAGEPGWFELFFDNPLAKGRLVPPEDEIDYSEIQTIDLVEPNQLLMTYHPAVQGKRGVTVSGLPILPVEVPELPPLTGTGFIYNAATKSYLASTQGYPSYNARTGCLSVCVVYKVHGDLSYYQNTHYDGTVHIYGSVLNHATIHATGDVIVEGHMENGFIYSDQNVIIKGGVNGGGTGIISAGGSIKGKFFEYTQLNANGSVEGNYFLNCHITTDDILTVRGKKARIMGGNINAAVGVEAVSIGNYLSNKTLIKIGDLEDIQNRIYTQEHLKKDISGEIDQLNAGLQKLISLLGEDQAHHNSLYSKTVSALEFKTTQLETCEKEIKRLTVVLRRAQKGSVQVHGDIQESVMFIINGYRKKIEKPIKHGIILNKQLLMQSKNL